MENSNEKRRGTKPYTVIAEASERDELTVVDMVDNRSSGIKYPMVTSQALVLYSESHLSDFEKIEIAEFENIFYLSPNSLKIQPTNAERLNNNGFDDAEGYYNFIKGDHLGYRF